MTEPTDEQAMLYEGILQGATRINAPAVKGLIDDYYDGDQIAVRIGLASGDVQLRPAFADGPDGEHIRIEFGRPGEHDHSITVPNPLHESEN